MSDDVAMKADIFYHIHTNNARNLPDIHGILKDGRSYWH
jgi:hypothetical protein